LIKRSKYDSISIGILSGIVLPFIILIILMSIRKADYPFFEYLKMTQQVGALPKLISLCLIPNLALFFIFIKLDFLKTARGVLLSMFIAGLVIVILKLI